MMQPGWELGSRIDLSLSGMFLYGNLALLDSCDLAARSSSA
jgi:hypothetical protein